MPKPTTIHSTFILERSYPVPPERVFAAFADPAKKRRWFLGGDRARVQHYDLDFRVGGVESATILLPEGTPVAGFECANETVFQNIVPNSRIVFTSTMNIQGNCVTVTLATVELLPTDAGTDLIFTHQGAFFEGSGGPAMREEGWRKLLDNLSAELSA
jgi:uncharacterized protein YndB with AHSA1/START domain